MRQRKTRISLAAAAIAVAASISGPAAADTATRIAAAFEAKGMPADQADCYGATVAGELGEERSAAAQAIETAENAQEIEENVKDGGLDMVQAFLAAKTRCGG